MDKYAIISDVHGNIWALESVLSDISRRGIHRILNLGDSVYGPLDPGRTADLLMNPKIISIRGNEDRIINERSKVPVSNIIDFVRKNLTGNQLDWLRSLPHALVIKEEFFLCHGTPSSDQDYLLEKPSLTGSEMNSPSLIVELLNSVRQGVILCGHSHIPRIIQLADGRMVVNPGSVGLQAYADYGPTEHRMQTGSALARYCILTRSTSGWSPEEILVAYDSERAAATARKNGRNDWAVWLMTGLA